MNPFQKTSNTASYFPVRITNWKNAGDGFYGAKTIVAGAVVLKDFASFKKGDTVHVHPWGVYRG